MKTEVLIELAKAFQSQDGSPENKLIEAIKSTGLNPVENSEEINVFMKIERISDIDGFLEEYVKQFDNMKSEGIKAKEKEAIIQNIVSIMDDLKKVQDEYKNNPIPNKIKLHEVYGQIEEIINVQSGKMKKLGLTIDNMFDFGAADGFRVNFLNGLLIPTPGATIIGTKTANGKTSSLINFAREFLERGKSVALISYEMRAQELGLALLLSMMAKNAMVQNPQYILDEENPIEIPENLIDEKDVVGSKGTDYFTHIRKQLSKKQIPFYIKDELEKLKEYMQSNRIGIFDDMGDINDLVSFIKQTKYDVYLIDYVQIIPVAKDNRKDGYMRVKSIADSLRPIVNAGKKCLIMGAQLNRESGDGTDGTSAFDPSVEQFREAADIEQLASLAIGVGWIKSIEGNKTYYWKILKHRYNTYMRDARMLSEQDPRMFRNYYLRYHSKWYKPEEWENYKSDNGYAKEKKNGGGSKSKGKKEIDGRPL